MRNLLGKIIILEISDTEISQLLQYFGHKLLHLNPIIREIEGGNTLTLQQPAQILDPLDPNFIPLKLERAKFPESPQSLNPLNHIITEIEINQINQTLQALNLSDQVLLEVQTAEVG
jgi:hypothetical protein